MTATALSVLLTLAAAAAAPPAPATPPVPQAAPEAAPSRAWLGVFLGDAVDGGVQILDVVPGGPAAQGGLSRGDILIRIDAADVGDRGALRRAFREMVPGKTAFVTVLRDGQSRTAPVVLGSAPPPAWSVFELPAAAPRAASSDAARALELAALGAVSADRALGAGFEEVPAELRAHLGGSARAGVLVTRVSAGGPSAGRLRTGDLVVEADGAPTAAVADLDGLVLARRAGVLRVKAMRAGRPVIAEIPFQVQRPEDAARERRVLALEETIRELEGTLAGLKRELGTLKGAPR
ncbi:MAG TPA: PDZ domain-containing protein [Candidatus Polarisedimenticolaceae bacterium]|nr:PDZ domain-containing protein [Candidatus Polarisedimenticolaceae bacterium]